MFDVFVTVRFPKRARRQTTLLCLSTFKASLVWASEEEVTLPKANSKSIQSISEHRVNGSARVGRRRN